MAYQFTLDETAGSLSLVLPGERQAVGNFQEIPGRGRSAGSAVGIEGSFYIEDRVAPQGEFQIDSSGYGTLTLDGSPSVTLACTF
jgi:hypothetical protein